MGCGPKPIRRENLTVRRMTKALVELVNRAAYRDAAAQMGARLQQEHGILTAADIVEQEVRGWR